ncbi:MAG: hypothetical protein AABX72_04695 [Nanoarchaeota archaeon]
MKRHSREKRVTKKGAIELSMTTIIIVVIGVTILTLGLRWIYGIFGGLEEQQSELERLTKDQITEILGGSDEAINIPTSVIDGIKKGESYNLRLVVRNKHPETHRFKYNVMVENTPPGTTPAATELEILSTKTEMSIGSGDGFRDFIVINTDTLPLGTYKMRIELICADCAPVQSETAPVIFEVVLK